MSYEDKLPLIEKIRLHHPADRPDKYQHYGWYIGGMRDSGDWNFEVMIKDSFENLKECSELLGEYKPPKQVEPRTSKVIEIELNGKKFWYDDEQALAEKFWKIYIRYYNNKHKNGSVN